jgi:hypothetical protein
VNKFRLTLALIVSATFAVGPSAVAQDLECRPQCRTGFTCLSGACVSACNPACAPNQTCTANGECVNEAPVAPAPISLLQVDHRWELAGRLGYQVGGEISPKGMFTGKTSGAPIVLLDASRVVHPFFLVGLFTHLSRSQYKQYFDDVALGDGHLTLWSSGVSGKVRLAVSDAVTIRVGGLVGANVIWASGKGDNNVSYSGHGIGFDLGATLEAAWRVSRQWGVTGQAGFSSQILTGSVKVDGDSKSHDLSYAPILFFVIGPELYL